jgi:hypothetical protein
MPGSMQQPQSEPAMNFDQLQQLAMNVVEGICSIVSMPVEIILRPQYGTRYFPVPVVFFSAMLMIFLPLLSSAATGVVNMIPFTHAQMPIGMFSIGSLSKLYFFLAFLHGIRLYRRMIYMELENLSQFEGPPLPFFRLIPGSGSFWFTRIVLEPIFVFVLATVLEQIFVIQSGLSIYLHIAALMLAMKNFICWYRAWEYIRQILDMRFAGPLIAKFVDNKATEDDMAQIHLASLPKNLSPEIRQAAGVHIARVYSPGNDTTSNR